MNYMKQVAQMLGVELEEEFLISNTGLICKFIDNGLLMKYIPKMTSWHYDNSMLRCLLSGKYEIVKIPKPILDDIEKRYLSNVIKPFRNQIESIVKYSYGKYEAINMVNFKVDENMSFIVTNFPYFKKGTMYKGMEVNKEYSLKDLGL